MALVGPSCRLPAGIPHDVGVAICNLEDRRWLAGLDDELSVSLAYRWLRRGDDGREVAAERRCCPLPEAIEPGTRVVAFMIVRTPDSDGRYVLEVDVVDHRARTFGRPARHPVTIGVAGTIRTQGRAEQSVSALPPTLEERRREVVSS